MTDCPHCHAASELPMSYAGGNDDCMVCKARELARSPTCFAAERAGYITDDYRRELEKIGGQVHWFAVHELVRAWQRGKRPPVPAWAR